MARSHLSKAGETKSITNIEKHLEGRIRRAGGSCNSKDGD